MYSCSEKKNQNRFRPVLSDHSLVSQIGRPLVGLLYQPKMIDGCGAFGRMRIERGNQKYSEESCPSATLSP
jgi:hypothetical protein